MVFGGMVLRNNSAFKLTEILTQVADALFCLTNRLSCCSDETSGSWYSPDGSRVSTAGSFYQSYIPERQAIALHRTITAYSNGLFTCAILDKDNVTRHLYIGSGKMSL